MVQLVIPDTCTLTTAWFTVYCTLYRLLSTVQFTVQCPLCCSLTGVLSPPSPVHRPPFSLFCLLRWILSAELYCINITSLPHMAWRLRLRSESRGSCMKVGGDH